MMMILCELWGGGAIMEFEPGGGFVFSGLVLGGVDGAEGCWLNYGDGVGCFC